MLFLVDIGNTNVKLGVVREGELVAHWRVATNRTSMPDEWWVVVTKKWFTTSSARSCAPFTPLPPRCWLR